MITDSYSDLHKEIQDLPVILIQRVNRFKDEPRVGVLVPGLSGKARAMSLRIMADALATLGSLGFQVVSVSAGSDGPRSTCYAEVAHPNLSPKEATSDLFSALYQAALREACVHTSLYPTSAITHRVEIR
jgi:hypothetical protein